MLIIGICDDEKEYRDCIMEYCDRYFSEFPMEHRYVQFNSGEEVLSFSDDKIDLLFLDIEMGGMSGVDVMNMLRDNDNVWRVVFVTNHPESQPDTIGLKALTFVTKPVSERIVFRCLETAISENSENVSLSFKGLNGSLVIPVDGIISVSAEGHYVRIWTKTGSILACESLKDCLRKFKNTPIIRVHRSHIINLNHVNKWGNNVIRLSNGQEIPVGRSYIKSSRESWFKHIGKTADRRFRIKSALEQSG